MRRAIALLALLTASAAACSPLSPAASTTPTPSPAATSSPSGLQFRLDGIHTSASGKVLLTTSGNTTTLELLATGLPALTSHLAQVRSGSCQQPGGVLFTLNQVTADATGAADTRTTIQAKYPPASGSWFAVVTTGPDAQGSNATVLLCGNLSTGPSSSALQFALGGIKTSASGKIFVTTSGDSTTIELMITGLSPASSHVSHVHSGSCQQQGGILFALNQVVADGTGAADTRTTVQAKYPPASGHWYVVVHAGPDMQGANATYLMCGNLF